MAVDKKFFVDINLQGNALNNATIGSNSDMTKGGSFRFDGERLEYYDGSSTQSVANLADISAVTGGLILQGGYDAATNTPDIADGAALKGFFWVVTEAGSFLGESVQVGDSIIAKVDNAGASIGDWLILQGNVVIATDSVDGIVRLATQEEVDGGTEGGAVVLTPATFESSSQLSGIRNDINSLADEKLNRDGSQAMTGSLDMGGNDLNDVYFVNTDTINTDNLVSNNNTNILLGSNIDANGATLFNLPTPTNGGDAANKQYVDDQAAAAQAAAEAYADSLAPNYDPAGSAATAESNANSYTDGVAATKLDLAGGTMSGNIDMGLGRILNASLQSVSLKNSLDAAENSIINLSAPTAGTDAANKTYVDSQATTAEINAKNYTDILIGQEVTDRNSAIATAKSEAIADANSYTDGAIAQEVTDRDAAIATAKSEAIADANSYTDTQIAAQSFISIYADTDWTLSGGVYTLSISHSINTSTPKVASYVSGNLVEFAVVVIDANTIELKSNIAAPASVSVGVSK